MFSHLVEDRPTNLKYWFLCGDDGDGDDDATADDDDDEKTSTSQKPKTEQKLNKLQILVQTL